MFYEHTVLLLWFISFVGKPKSPDVDKAFRRSSPADSIRGLLADEQTEDKVNALGFGYLLLIILCTNQLPGNES